MFTEACPWNLITLSQLTVTQNFPALLLTCNAFASLCFSALASHSHFCIFCNLIQINK